jgi:UDP-3-O-[3-hydroxymyristoyl] N-acetylglucosamine deacetylase
MSIPLSQAYSVATSPSPFKRRRLEEDYQATLKSTVSCTGIGVHSGQSTVLVLEPAEPNSGYVFIRTDIANHNKILGHFGQVIDTQMCTKIANSAGVSVGTIEHVIAALAGAHITNAIIKVSGPEVPIMDGSSAIFTDLIERAGVKNQDVLLPTLKVSKPMRVTAGQAYAEFIPSQGRLITLKFDGHGRLSNTLKVKELTFDWDHDDFGEFLSDARTFGFYEDAQKLLSLGLAKGASLENTVVIQSDNSIMNPEGLRSQDEFVRHKILDAVGDLALAGVRIQGHFRGYNSGHALNNMLLHALFKQEGLAD